MLARFGAGGGPIACGRVRWRDDCLPDDALTAWVENTARRGGEGALPPPVAAPGGGRGGGGERAERVCCAWRVGFGAVTLVAGDQVTVTGSSLNCMVSTATGAAHPTTIVCGEGNLRKPAPGTYAFAMADAAALVLKSSASSQPVLVAHESQPAIGGSFPASQRRSSQSIHLGIGKVFVVGGTDVLCAVTKQSTGPAITCGLAAASGTFVVGSDAALLTKRSVILSRFLGHSKFKTLTNVAQPASPACKLCA